MSETTPSLPTETPRVRIPWPFWLLLPLVFALGLGAGYLAFARPLAAQLAEARAQLAAAANPGADAAAQQPVRRYDVPVDDDPAVGPANAPITIIEFSDFECPFCRSWQTEVWPQIKQKYGDKVRLVYRDFPLFSIHANAAPAAEAANCAGEQNQYWAFHDALFSGKYPYSRSSYEAIAANLGLDGKKFAACLDERRFQAEVQADYDYAANLGVGSTPTFFINGLAVVGAQPFEVFSRVIDMELNGEIPK